MSTAGDVGALISWGIDPTDDDVISYGGGIYADKFCLTTADYTDLAEGNCAMGLPLVNTNALELTWTLPAG